MKLHRTEQARALTALGRWAQFAELHWRNHPDTKSHGWFGTGYNAWGVQTNQKYSAAMAVLATNPAAEVDHQWALDRAIASFRFSVDSHHSGPGQCADGTSWGHTWISALGLERMMHGVELLRPHLSDMDTEGLERVLTSESDWLTDHYHRLKSSGVTGDVWNSSGRNAPESNIWNGALLWRTATLYPDHPHADRWRERACEFLINGVSIAADATNSSLLDGAPISERFRGANFFDNYALDHHGYLNVGYMVICASNAAILHFDQAQSGRPAPESLHHHQKDLWSVLRKMVFGNGRLARIGGDSRVRYTYCQEYLLPSLLYAADVHRDPHAGDMLSAQLELIETEQSTSDDGRFYGSRLRQLGQDSPYYYTRLESDRACALSLTATYLPTTDFPAEPTVSYEDTVAGGWHEPDHGAVLHRSPRRLASFSWRAYGLTQGLCQPPDDGHLAEWTQNLAGEIVVLGDQRIGGRLSRKLRDYRTTVFDGGFATAGTVIEGAELALAEGWSGSNAVTNRLAIVALPDDRTMVGLQLCRTADWMVHLRSVKGLHLTVPNDLYNDFTRRIDTAQGTTLLTAESVFDVDTDWLCVDDRLGVIGLYGADTLAIQHSAGTGGLRGEEICFPYLDSPGEQDPNSVILDSGWAVLSDAGKTETQQFAASHTIARQDDGSTWMRAVRITGADNKDYLVIANLGEESAEWQCDQAGTELVSRRPVDTTITVDAAAVTVIQLD